MLNKLIALLGLAGWLFCVLMHQAEPLTITLGNNSWEIASTGLVAVSGLAGIAMMWGVMQMRLADVTRFGKKVNRELERTAVSAETSSEQVKALEAKVKTLETALEKALQSKV